MEETVLITYHKPFAYAYESIGLTKDYTQCGDRYVT